MTTIAKKVFSKAKIGETDETGETSRNGKNGKNEEKDKNLGINLAQVPYIQYLITFQKKFVLVLLESRSEINVIHLTFTKELGFSIKLTNFEA